MEQIQKQTLKQRPINDFFSRQKDFKNKFPNDETKKKLIFNNLNEILEACGCYLNDSKFIFKYENDTVILKNVYTEKTLDTEGTDGAGFCKMVMELLQENVKELKEL